MDFNKLIDNSYKEKLITQLTVEPYLAKIAREERERKEQILRDVIPPFRAWLAAKLKWRWLLRAYRIEESYQGDKRIYRVFKGKTMMHETAFDAQSTVMFKRF